MELFRFEPLGHKYTLGNRLLKSTTGILKDNGLIDSSYFTEEARWRGECVHLACAYYSRGVLNWESLDKRIVPYIRAYAKFCVDLEFTAETVEEPIYHPAFKYATTPDAIGPLRGKITVVELKSGAVLPWVAFQTAAQALAKFQSRWLEVQRVGLQLNDDGTYSKPVWFREPTDGNLFLSMLALSNWKDNNGYPVYKQRIAA